MSKIKQEIERIEATNDPIDIGKVDVDFEVETKEDVDPQVEELAPHLNVKPDPVDPITKLGKKTGVVANCNSLYLREGANRQTKQLMILKVGEKVSVDLDNSTPSFYEVTYNSIVGYCVKEYIILE